jgi:hypothetical protein
MGPMGPEGTHGSPGPAGAQGIQGDPGADGLQGEPGPATEMDFFSLYTKDVPFAADLTHVQFSTGSGTVFEHSGESVVFEVGANQFEIKKPGVYEVSLSMTVYVPDIRPYVVSPRLLLEGGGVLWETTVGTMGSVGSVSDVDNSGLAYLQVGHSVIWKFSAGEKIHLNILKPSEGIVTLHYLSITFKKLHG